MPEQCSLDATPRDNSNTIIHTKNQVIEAVRGPQLMIPRHMKLIKYFMSFELFHFKKFACVCVGGGGEGTGRNFAFPPILNTKVYSLPPPPPPPPLPQRSK